MAIESVFHNCKNGAYGLSVISNGHDYFFPYSTIETILCSEGVRYNVDMTGFKEIFDSVRESVHELAWHTEGWDKNKKQRLEDTLNRSVYWIYSVGVNDGREYEKKKK
ncbi:MAG: hypothetical protein KKC55_16380 [Gammaproteobacteria bacterium]|nr:hypothetical protein [Gammaproteobacteria bacterium]